MILKDQYSFDQFHEDGDQIYRVNTEALRKNNSTESYATTVAPLGSLLKESYPQVEMLTMLHFGIRGEFATEEKAIPVRGYYTDSEFFQIFNFELAGASTSQVLSKPFTVLLTDEYSEKLFGEENPLGQTVILNGGDEYTVTGIISKKNVKTHFDFEVLASRSTIQALIQKDQMTNFIDDWSNIYGTYIYLKLRPGAIPEELESQFGSIAEVNFKDVVIESRTKSFSFFLQPLTAITPGPRYSNNMGRSLPGIVLTVLAVFSLLILITACFNFTNLSIARSLTRAREIGVRKVQGAAKSQIFYQFIGESILFAFFSMFIAYFLLKLLVPAFTQLEIFGQLNISFQEDFSLYFYFTLFTILCGLMAGFLPAWYLSSFDPLKVIRNSAQSSLKKGPWITRMNIRKGLMVFQFGLCLIFILIAIVAGKQVRYMMDKEIGVRTEDVVNIRLRDVDFQIISTEVKSLPGVIDVSGISIALGTWADQSSDYRKSYEEEKRGMRDFFVDRNYVNNMDIQVIAGQSFPEEVSDLQEQFVLLNQEALNFFGWESTADALGQPLIIDDSTEVQVIGIIKDFHFRPMTNTIGPMAFRYRPDNLSIMNVRVGKEYREKTLADLENIWSNFDPEHQMEWQYMESEIRNAYDYFRDMEKVMGFFGFLSVSIASLGLLGMVIFSLETKMREVGIRKVLGATYAGLFIHLSRQFVLLLLVAMILFIPVGILLGNEYLNGFAYKIEIDIILISMVVLIIGGIGLLTIGSQVIRATRVNPIEIIRQE